MNIVEEIGNGFIAEGKAGVEFEIGDSVKVHYRIVEGNRERIQIFEGTVIAINNKGVSKTFTVRKNFPCLFSKSRKSRSDKKKCSSKIKTLLSKR